MANKDHLTTEDWLKAAFRALSTGGVQAVRAEALARQLGVSKGSFYWHFKDVPALKAAMLDHWCDQATGAIIAEVADAAPTPAAQIRLLVDIAAGDLDADYGGRAVEGAIRFWGSCEPEVGLRVAEVDQVRLSYLTDLLATCALTAEQAENGAYLLYGALIGLPFIAQPGALDLRDRLHRLLQMIAPSV